jgi:hypothetical protein
MPLTEMYNKKEDRGKSFGSNLMPIEETYSISSLVSEEDSNSKDERLDETDIIDYCEEDYEWLHILILNRLLKRINNPEEAVRGEHSYKNNYLKEPAEVPYILRDLNKAEQEEKKTEPEETEDLEYEIEERMAA